MEKGIRAMLMGAAFLFGCAARAPGQASVTTDPSAFRLLIRGFPEAIRISTNCLF
jgi:hypothetical protein